MSTDTSIQFGLYRMGLVLGHVLTGARGLQHLGSVVVQSSEGRGDWEVQALDDHRIDDP